MNPFVCQDHLPFLNQERKLADTPEFRSDLQQGGSGWLPYCLKLVDQIVKVVAEELILSEIGFDIFIHT